jgi:hypothetical protein
MTDNIIGLNGKTIKPIVKKETYNLRVCLIGSDDIDIKRVETFGVAEDGFFMVKSLDNSKFPIFMTNPIRIKTIETYKEGDTPLTKLKNEKSDDDFLVNLLKEQNEKQSKA